MNPTLVAVVTYKGDLGWCKVGDTTWKGYHTSDKFYSNVVFHDNKLYAVERGGLKVNMFKYDQGVLVQVGSVESTNPIEHIPDFSRPIRSYCLIVYLVECGGKVYVVKRFSDDTKFHTPTINFIIFAVEEICSMPRLVKVENLNDHVLFVANLNIECIDVKYCSKFQRDSIYFTCNSESSFTTEVGLFLDDSWNLAELEEILQEAKQRWLRSAEICKILCNYQRFELTSAPPVRPPAGSVFLFDRKALRYFRKDGHRWRKKKDGKTIREAHEKLKAGSVDVLHCYYAHGEDNENFQRRSYWMLDEQLEHIVLVHYRKVKEGCKSGITKLPVVPVTLVGSSRSGSAPFSNKISSPTCVVQTSLTPTANKDDLNGQASEYEEDNSLNGPHAQPISNPMPHSAPQLADEATGLLRNPIMSSWTSSLPNFSHGNGLSPLGLIQNSGLNTVCIHDKQLHVEGSIDGPEVDFTVLKLGNSRLDAVCKMQDHMISKDRLITDVYIQPVTGASKTVNQVYLEYRESYSPEYEAESLNILFTLDSLGPCLSQEQLFSIHDFSPDWAYAGVRTKVYDLGLFHSCIITFLFTLQRNEIILYMQHVSLAFRYFKFLFHLYCKCICLMSCRWNVHPCSVLCSLPFREETVIVLVKLGAAPGAVQDPTSAFPRGHTAADLASSRGHKGIAGYLAEADLKSQLSILSTVNENEMYNIVTTTEADNAFETAEGDSPNMTMDEQHCMKESLVALRKSAHAAASIQAAFRARSFCQRQLAKSSSDNSEAVLDLVADSLNKVQNMGHFEDYLHFAALRIQKRYHGWKGRKDFLKIRNRIIKIQAHIRGHQVRKQYKKVVWSVSIVEKAILRWRRKGAGLRGFRIGQPFGIVGKDAEKSDEYDFLSIGRRQKSDDVKKALDRVKSMVRSPEARDQYMRLIMKYQNSKVDDGGSSPSQHVDRV
ncbi:uncharacterized protein LOC130713241 [Lotus japonicus]|uniref:uncharacterized protein LOC130713241 n=1 Tax=Lotus japonicus TaxID=34305 RepID=UPI00258E8A5F|nr:uncharacterized protein LOC130713241 [Lotus japonicus]